MTDLPPPGELISFTTKANGFGTRVRYNSPTGTVIDPDEPGRGQPYRGYRPPYPAAWVYLDPEHHSRCDGLIWAGGATPGPRHGMWSALDDPSLTVLTG